MKSAEREANSAKGPQPDYTIKSINISYSEPGEKPTLYFSLQTFSSSVKSKKNKMKKNKF